jgi:hypothetical protein
MYHAYGLLLPKSDFTLAAAAKKLASVFPAMKQKQTDRSITLSSGDWDIHLTLEDGPDVLEESIRIADHVGDAEGEVGIATCNRRVDVASDDPDPEMDHFNDYLQIIEVLQTFVGVIPVDPKEPSLL